MFSKSFINRECMTRDVHVINTIDFGMLPRQHKSKVGILGSKCEKRAGTERVEIQ